MSSNLLKRGYTLIQMEEARVIDTNTLMERRLEELAALENRRMESQQQPFSDGFVAGLGAQEIVLPAGEEEDGGFSQEISGNVIKAGEDAARIREEAQAAAGEILENARAEADQIRQEAEVLARQESSRVLEQARSEGYAAGREQAEQEADHQRRELERQRAELERDYGEKLEAMEAQLVETITGVYEHIFHVELESCRDILVYLIGSAMSSAEGANSFLVHVSKEDYPYVSMQRRQIQAEAASPNSTVEFVEDLTLHKNECLIETEGGIFDCGLGSELEELGKKLRLLSYEKQVKDH